MADDNQGRTGGSTQGPVSSAPPVAASDVSHVPIQENEKGPPAPSQAVAITQPGADYTPGTAKRILTDFDLIRAAMGFASFAVGVGTFLYVIRWVIGSLDAGFREAAEMRYQLLARGEFDAAIKLVMTPPMLMVLGAKAVLVATVASFSAVMVKTGEHMTMPLARYTEFIRVRYAKSKDEAAGDRDLATYKSIVKDLLDRLFPSAKESSKD